MQMRKRWLDAYDGLCFFGGLVFFAPAALLVRTRAGVTTVKPLDEAPGAEDR